MTKHSPQRVRATPPARRSAPRSIAVAAWLYTALLALCPPGFRRAHGREMAQLFRQLCGDAWAERGSWGVALRSGSALADLLWGALAESVSEYSALLLGAFQWRWGMARMRSSAIVLFCAYIALVLDGIAFQKSTEDVVKSSLPSAHPALAVTYLVIQGAAALGLLATLAGGVPLAVAALRQAISARNWGTIALFAVPPLLLAVWLIYTWLLLNVIFPAHIALSVHQTVGFGLAASWIALFLLAAVLSVAAVSMAIAHSDISPRLYRFALAPETGVVLAMALTAAGVAAWSIQLRLIAPAMLAAPDGPIGLKASLGSHLVADFALMLLATLVALAGRVRGGRVARQRELPGPTQATLA